MASTYPTTLDTLATNKADGTATATDHAAHHNDLADAINKIEAELGTDPSGASYATVKLAIADKQPLDADLTAIAGLTATTDSFMQAKGSAWSARTVAQVITDLAAPSNGFFQKTGGGLTGDVSLAKATAAALYVTSSGSTATINSDGAAGNWAKFLLSLSGTDKGALYADGGILKLNDNTGVLISSDLSGNVTLGNATGTLTAARSLAMGSNKITGLATGTANGDALRFEDKSGYTIQGHAIVSAAPADNANLYFGSLPTLAPQTAANSRVLIVPKAGKIKAAWVDWIATTSAEQIDVYVRINNATNYLINSIANTSQVKRFQNWTMNSGSGITVAAGDSIEFYVDCPTWATNPTDVGLNGLVYIEST